MYRTLIAILIIPAVLFLAGCGGGGGSSTPAVLSPPTNLNVSVRTTDAPSPVTLTWSAPASGAPAQYGIYRKILGQNSYSRIAVVPGSQTSYVDDLTSIGLYRDVYYQVVSINSSGVESTPTNSIFSEAPVPPPG